MQPDHLLLILLGILLILAPIIKRICESTGVPAMVGYILIGLLASVLNDNHTYLTPLVKNTLEALAELGLVAMLFKVGLTSNIRVLVEKLPDASVIWCGDVLTNLAFGFLLSRYFLSLPLETSLVVATAFSATSVAVSVVVWDEFKQLNSPNGQLLVDVAELDDLSGVILLAILLAIIPALNNESVNIFAMAGSTALIVIVKLILFIAACYIFAHNMEARFTRFISNRSSSPTALIIAVLGAAFIIAAIAGYLGFSLAIGALFAGLAFSRDRKTISQLGKFDYFYDFFTPFFFIYIGIQVNPEVIFTSLDLGLIFFLVATSGKMIGVGLPALCSLDRLDAFKMGISMVPRAEIALVVVYQCRSLFGESVISEQVFAAIVLTSLLTSIVAPFVLRNLIVRTS